MNIEALKTKVIKEGLSKGIIPSQEDIQKVLDHRRNVEIPKEEAQEVKRKLIQEVLFAAKEGRKSFRLLCEGIRGSREIDKVIEEFVIEGYVLACRGQDEGLEIEVRIASTKEFDKPIEQFKGENKFLYGEDK